MAKTVQERIQKCESDIAEAQKKIQAAQDKIASLKSIIRNQQQRIRTRQEEKLTLEAGLLADRYRASNLTLEDALAALDLQGGA